MVQHLGEQVVASIRKVPLPDLDCKDGVASATPLVHVRSRLE